MAAVAAWRAASASERTRARASEAVANTIIPMVRYSSVQRVRDDDTVTEDNVGVYEEYVFPTQAGKLIVSVIQVPPFAARDVDVLVIRDGSRYRGEADWLLQQRGHIRSGRCRPRPTLIPPGLARFSTQCVSGSTRTPPGHVPALRGLHGSQ